MSRASVHPDIAERVLGHVQQGVLGTYDRHAYKEEKREALSCIAVAPRPFRLGGHPSVNLVLGQTCVFAPIQIPTGKPLFSIHRFRVV